MLNPPQKFSVLRSLSVIAALVLPLFLASCGSSPSKGRTRGAPARLPTIDLHGSASTPSHSMSHADYPFDSNGNYITSWAAEGEARAGRNAYASTSYSDWRSSHSEGGGAARKSSSSSGVKKSSTSSTTARTKSAASTTKKKSVASTTKKKPSSSSHTVRKGDTLSAIARKYGTSVAKIKAANGLSSDIIRDGKSLKVPR